MILGTEQAAAVRRAADLNLYIGDLKSKRRRAYELGRADDVAALDALIRSAETDADDAQAIVDLYKRQQDSRDATRVFRGRVREQFEQLMLRPQAQVL